MAKQWIKVTDKHPKDSARVNAYNVKTNVHYPELYFDEDKKKWYDENYVENGEYDLPPTHWCSIGKLPTVPNE